jgi:hypothetical protein
MSFQINDSEKENAVKQFIEKYGDQIEGVLSGFDRLVFRGSLRRLNYSQYDPHLGAMAARGMEEYLWQNQILFKDYSSHVKRISEQLKTASLKPFHQPAAAVIFDRGALDKDQLARQIAGERKIEHGLVCAISTLEPSPTFEHRGTRLLRRIRPCGVLYHYQNHAALGGMYGRVQTWFPFHIQIGINGREGLARQMQREGMKYRQQGNCFVWIEDYPRAQELLHQQLQREWSQLLEGIRRQWNPIQERIFERYRCDYYWTVYQSEWATDLAFRDGRRLPRLMEILIRHGMLSYQSRDVLRLFGKRGKYTRQGHSTKFYDQAYSQYGGVLRAAETTMNNAAVFRAYRAKEGGPETDLQWRPMRKGIADLHRRAEISPPSNERLIEALASVDDSRSVEELTAGIPRPSRWGGRRVRALRPWGEDQKLLAAINRGEFWINGFRNRDLQVLL